MILFFFDSGIYKIGERKQSCFLINRTQDIDEINKLQFINCFENIYFNEKASEFYVKQIYQQSKKYKKANAAKSELSYIFEDVDDRQKILDSGKKIF